MKGKAASIAVGLFAICCTCSVLSSAVRGTGQAVGLVATNTAVPPTQIAVAVTQTERVIVVTATAVPASATPVASTSTPLPTRTMPPLPPTITPAPPTVASGPSQAVQTYIQSIATHTGEMGTALGEIATLMGNPRPFDNDWKTDVAIQLASIQVAYQAVEKIHPVPPEAQKLHAAILDAMGDCNSMTSVLADGIDTLNADTISKATDLMTSCGNKIKNAQPLLNELK